MEASCDRRLGDRRDVDAVLGQLRAMIEQGAIDAALALVGDLLAQVRDRNDALQIRLQNALRQLYGRRSETLSPDQLELFEALAGTAEPAAKPATEPAAEPAAEPVAPRTKKARPHGRSERPAGLPCERTEIPVAEADRICARCGARMAGFGSQESWRVEFVPGRFVVQVAACEKVSCSRCRDAVVTAPAPPAVIPGSPVGPGLLARILVDKAEDHLPLDRQRKRFAREGFEVQGTTLEGWWAQHACEGDAELTSS
jgi:transposase